MMGRKVRLRKDEGGYAFALVLILLILIGLVIGPLLLLMTTSLMSSQRHEQSMLSFYAADAGIEDAVYKLLNDDDNLPEEVGGSYGYPEYPALYLNDGEIHVTIEKVEPEDPSDETYKITSTASSDSGSTTIESYVEVTGGSSSIFGAAITVANGDLYIEDTDVDGDIWVSGGFDSEGSEVTGEVYDNQGEGEFDPLDPEPYRTEALGGITLEGNQKIDEDTTWDTPIYITGDLNGDPGDLKIEEGVTLTLGGTVWVEGSIHVEGLEDSHTFITGEGNLIAELGNIWIEYLGLETTNMPLVWAVHGNIERIETNQYIKAIIYAPEGYIQIETTDVIYGVVFGETVTLMENCTIVYPTEGDGGGPLDDVEPQIELRTYTIQ